MVCLRGQNESLQYSINWPTGLSFGEGSLTSKRAGSQWELELVLDASLPGIPIKDLYRSQAGEGMCSLRFDKESAHGPRRASEISTFDVAKGTMTRETHRGGKSVLQVGSCARDALAFLFHLRQELAKGRLPAPQRIYFGAGYQLALSHTGTDTVVLGDSRVEGDRIAIAAKGPASETSFEIVFGRDAARTPLRIKAPLPVGTVTMELVR